MSDSPVVIEGEIILPDAPDEMKFRPVIQGSGGFFSSFLGGANPQTQQSSPPQRNPDNLRSTDHIEMVLGLAEGQIKGLKDGSAKNFYIGDTPLLSPDGTPNFNQFKLEMYHGDHINDSVLLVQRGASIGHNVGVNIPYSANFASNPQWLVRQGTVTASSTTVSILPASGTFFGQIYEVTNDGFWMWTDKGWRRTNDPYVNYIQIRLNVHAMYRETDQGTFDHGGFFYIELKRSNQSDAAYQRAVGHYAGTNQIRAVGGGSVTEDPTNQSNFVDQMVLKGKTTQNYLIDFVIPVARSTVPYTIRITQLTNPLVQTSSGTDVISVGWDSFAEVTSEVLKLPDLAFAHLTGQASDQFSSIPEFWGVYDGIYVHVPSNYNEVTRVYTGLWDGTFKMAYTNNPAWCLYELVTNDTWGMSRFSPMTMDKYDIYDAAQWCDGMVSDGKGGLQPRYTLNHLIAESRNVYDMAKYMAGVFNATFFDDGNGTAYLRVDKDDAASYLITPEMVIGGIFEYSHTDVTQRYNYITTSFVNPDLQYDTDRRLLTLPAHISEYGTIVAPDLIALGADNQQEALRRAMYKLLTATTETKMVTFKMPRAGQYLHPFTVFLLADPDLGYGLSGRIQSLNPARTLATLRDAVYLEAGVTYVASFQLPNPNYPTNSSDEYYIYTANLVSPTVGANTTLSFASALPASIPDKAVFSLQQATGGIGLPKPFRVVSIEETDGDPDQLSITGIEINRNKWSDVDNLTSSGVYNYSSLSFTDLPAPTGFGVSADFTDPNHPNILLSWDRIPNRPIRAYRIQYRFNGGPLQDLYEASDIQYEFHDAPIGGYVFYLRAIAINGDAGKVVPLTIDLTDPNVVNPSGVGSVTNLRLVTGNWTGRAFILTWDPPTAVGIDHYIVNVINPANSAVIRTTNVSTNEFEYTEAMNAADHSGVPIRSILMSVQVVTNNLDINRAAQTSVAVNYTANNPAPVAPAGITMAWVPGGLSVAFTTPSDNDFINTLVWAKTTTVWSNTDAPTHILSGNPIIIPDLDKSQTYYLHLAHNDLFGLALNYSNQINVTSGVPTVPVSLTFTANRQALGGQQGRVTLNASWPASATPSLVDKYILEVRDTASSPWVEYIIPATSLSWSLQRGNVLLSDAYQARLRAVTNTNISSPYTAIVTATIINDTTGPGAITNLGVEASYSSLKATWTNPIDDDLAYVELWVNTSQTLPATRTYVANGNQYTFTVTDAVQRYVWMRAVDYSGNFGPYTAMVTAATVNTPTALTLTATKWQVGYAVFKMVINATWAQPANPTLIDHYVLQLRDNSSAPWVDHIIPSRDILTYSETRELALTTDVYQARIKSVSMSGQESAYSSIVTVTFIPDTTAPNQPTNLTMVGNYNMLVATWQNPGDDDFKTVEVYVSSNTTRLPTPTDYTPSGQYYMSVPANAQRYLWVRAVDYAGNFSNFVGPVTATATAVSTLDTVPGPPATVGTVTLNSSTAIGTDGSLITYLNANWPANVEADFARYEVYIKETVAGNYVSFFTGAPNYQWIVKPNTTYYVKVRAYDAANNAGNFSIEVNLTTGKDTTAPGPPTNFTVVAGFENMFINWTNPVDTDFDYVEIWESTTNDRATATMIAKGAGSTLIRSLPNQQTRYYWARAVDTSENASAWTSAQNAGIVATSLNINSSTQIANGVIITPHIIVNTLLGDRIQAGTLDANRIAANTIIAGSVTIGTSGVPLSTVAIDPATRINSNTVLIDPGKIQVFGSTTLADWRFGGDNTKISGGAIAANTILANRLALGSRGIDIADIQISADGLTNTVSWTGGTISYVNEAGVTVNTTITSGSDVWNTGIMNLYWIRGETILRTAVYGGSNLVDENPIVARYRGTNQLSTFFTSPTAGYDFSTTCVFSTLGNVLSWTAGTVTYKTTPSGADIVLNIPSGNVTWTTSEVQVYWIRGESKLRTRVLGTDQVQTQITMCEYRGGSDFTPKLSSTQLAETDATTTIVFSRSGNTLSWTAGNILHTASNGVRTTVAISAGSILWTGGTVYIYWTKGQTTLGSRTVGVVQEPNQYQLAFYRGGWDLVANFGRTLVDGADIVTGSIRANQLYAGELITNSAQIRDAIITNAKVLNLSADKLTAGFISADRIATQLISTDKITIGGVTTDRIAGGAVTAASVYYSTTYYNLIGPNTYIGGTALTVTTSSGLVVLTGVISAIRQSFQWVQEEVGSGSGNFVWVKTGLYYTQVALYCDGNPIQFMAVEDGNNPIMFTHTPGVGSHSYQLYITGNSGYAHDISAVFFQAMEFRR